MTHRDGVAGSPDADGVIQRLNAGEPFVDLSVDDRDRRAAALEAALAGVVADETRVVWVGNPLRSPLTIERFLIQVVGAEVDLRVERGPEELAAIIARRVGNESRLLIVVQQPETIDAPTRDQLVAMAPFLRDGAVRTQFLFAGSTAFVVPAAPSLDRMPLAPEARLPARRVTATVVLLLVAIVAGLWFSLAPGSRDGSPPASPAPSAPPEPPAPVASTSPAAAPPPAAAEVPDQTALLRREFDAFLAERAASLPPLSDSQKDALFLEFLAHRNHE